MNGVKFDDTHSGTWGIYLSNTEIEKPTPKTIFVPIPLGDGSVDLSEASGEVKYDRRIITMSLFYPSSAAQFEDLLTILANEIHGKRKKITFDKDPNYYYVGRCDIDYKKSDVLGTITIKAICEPYKYKLLPTQQIEAVSGSKVVTVANGRKTAFPKITTTAAFSIVKDGVTYSYGAVSSLQTTIPLFEGSNSLTITGTGTITFDWQEGAL